MQMSILVLQMMDDDLLHGGAGNDDIVFGGAGNDIANWWHW